MNFLFWKRDYQCTYLLIYIRHNNACMHCCFWNISSVSFDVLSGIINFCILNKTTCGLDAFPIELLIYHLTSIIMDIVLRFGKLCFTHGVFPTSCGNTVCLIVLSFRIFEILFVVMASNRNFEVCRCCLPTPLTIASGGERRMFPRAVHQPASPSIWPASSITPAGSVHKSRSENLVRMRVQLKRWCVLCGWVLQRGNSGDECDLVSTLCKYDYLKKGASFVLNWERVRRWGEEVSLLSVVITVCGSVGMFVV